MRQYQWTAGLLALTAWIGLCMGSGTAIAQVPNDDCENATVATSLPYTFVGNLNGSTFDCDALYDAADIGEAWLQFTLDEPARVKIEYCGSSPAWQTIFIILVPDCPCNEDNFIFAGYDFTSCPDGNATLYFPLLEAGTYYHPVFETTGSQGDYNITAEVIPAPVNDACEDALPIFQGDTNFSNIGGTTDGPAFPGHESCDAFDDDQVNQDIWYEFMSDCTGEIIISTCGLTDVDTKLAVYEGCTCPDTNDNLLVCNDDGEPDACGLQSYVTFPATEDACYLVRLGGFGASEGTGTINIFCDIPFDACIEGDGDCYGLGENTTAGCDDPQCCDLVCEMDSYCCEAEWDFTCVDAAWQVCDGPVGAGACCEEGQCTGIVAEEACDGIWFEGQNCDQVNCVTAMIDFCASSTPIYDGDTNIDTTLATTDGPAHEGCQFDGQTYNDIWFEYIATATGDLIVSTCNTADYDTDLVVYDGCACPVTDDRMLACNDDGTDCANFSSLAVAPVSEGQCYKIRIGGYGEGSVGTATVNLTVDVFNEMCLQATEPCFEVHDTPGCADAECCDMICDDQPFCCEVEWDQQCRETALAMCGGLGACCNAEGICQDSIPEADCTGEWFQEASCETVNCTNVACLEADGDCWGIDPNTTPACDNPECCDLVCDADAYCCEVEWDANCVEMAWSTCGGPPGRGACCVENEECQITTEAECAGLWLQGIHCSMIDCNNPISDVCPGPAIEPGQVAEGFTTGMTVDEDYPTCGTSIDAPGVWYLLTGNGHTMVATTCNPATNYDTKLSVFCASCTDPYCVGGNDDGSPTGASPDPDCVVPETGSEYNRASTVRFCSVYGAEYYVLVHGYGEATGTFGLEILDEGECDTGDPECIPASGACCDGLTCIGDMPMDECDGAWYGAMSCADFVCPAGACCDGDTCVGTLPESACEYRWFEGEDCATFDCPSCEYCEPCYTNIDDDYITNVTFGDINRDSVNEGACSYYDGTNLSTTVDAGSTYPISVTFFSEGQWTECVKVYTDWNMDCAFTEDEAVDLGCGIDATLTGDIVVPAGAAQGCTVMRVIEEYSGAPEDACNLVGTSFGEAEDYRVCVEGGEPADLVGSMPAADSSLWRAASNYATLTFSGNVNAPAAGELMIQALLDDGAYGPDLSGDFTFTANGSVLEIIENGSALTHGTWYALRSNGWAGVNPFEVHLVLIIGDANADGRALPNDLSLINSDIPNFDAPIDSRMDVTGEGMVLPNDLSVSNAYIPTFNVPKPAGH